MITKKVLQRVANKPVVLIAEELSPATLEALGPDFEVRNCNGADRAELLAALGKGVDAVLIRSATKMDAEAIAAAKGLKVIARAGVGLDNVEIPAATAAGVMVVNAPTSNIVSAAELAIGLLLASARFISPAHAALRNGKWARSKYTGAELFEKTLGIVGFGRIGKQIAEVAKAFQMNILVSDIKLDTSEYSFVKASSTSEIFQSCSIVVIAVTDSHENVDLIDEKYLSLIPEDGTVLINCSRGRILNENHVKKYFLRNRIKSLGLDVLKNETQSENTWLSNNEIWKLIHDYPHRVRITPHIGGATWDSLSKAENAVFSTLRDKVK